MTFVAVPTRRLTGAVGSTNLFLLKFVSAHLVSQHSWTKSPYDQDRRNKYTPKVFVYLRLRETTSYDNHLCAAGRFHLLDCVLPTGATPQLACRNPMFSIQDRFELNHLIPDNLSNVIETFPLT